MLFKINFFNKKKKFLQQKNICSKSAENVNIVRYFNPNELQQHPDKDNSLKYFTSNLFFVLPGIKSSRSFK